MHKINYKFSKDQKCFIHIPKSGGTTFRTLVDEYKVDVVADGLHRPVSAHCPPSEYDYIIILRDPVERVISHRNMLKRNGIRGDITGDLGLFLRSYWEVNNQMTLYLAGVPCDKYCDRPLRSHNLVTEEIYERAKRNLDNMKHVIFFKNLSRDLTNFFKNEYDITLTDIPNKNFHRLPKLASLSDTDLIIDHNKYDLLLYEYAKENFLNA
jgi:hypothetical protein